MNQLYFKNFIYGSVTLFVLIQPQFISAQRASSSKKSDRYDLVANINKMASDRHRIENLKILIDNSKKSKNKKSLKTHREKLVIEKKNLKVDYAHAREQESTYKENKAKRIKKLEADLKASNTNYADIRKKTKNDLAKKNDYALRKDADELLKAVQQRNDIYTRLSMEKSEMLETVNAMDDAWKKLKHGDQETPEKNEKVQSNNNLTNK